MNDLPEIPMKGLMNRIKLEITVAQGLHMLATMQLAFRHPRFKTSPTAKATEPLARKLQEAIVKAEPSLSFICEAGWKERFDR